MRGTRRIGLIGLILLSQVLRGQDLPELAEATRPLDEGVPEIAVIRLQALLGKSLSDRNWRLVAEKLAEAEVAAKQPQAALKLLDDSRLQNMPAAKFWRAQALAGLGRWKEALSFYEQAATGGIPALQAEATFGAGEMLRALGRIDDAIRKFSILSHDPQWGIRAQLRTVELFLDQSEPGNAKRQLDKMQPKTIREKKTRHFLRGRLEMVSHRPERAIPVFESLLKKPEGAGHAVLMAALFGIADAHLVLKTPESGDDALEDYIGHYPNDVDLPRIFAKLDELYRAERKPSRAELENWIRDPAQPRRGLARWYLARLDLRAGRRDRALHLFADLYREAPKSPALSGALLEYAEQQMGDRHFDDAIASLNEARALRPAPALLARIDFLTARANYLAKRFDLATAAFEQIAHSPSPWAKLALFNASAGWLQVDDRARFLTDYEELKKQGGNEQSLAELQLESGLVQAAKGNPSATQTLQEFIRQNPRSPRISEAWVTLAELAFHASPPRLDEARKNLARAAEEKPSQSARERSDYLLIWIEDSTDGDETKVINLANYFLQQHADSPFAPDVRMKLAETYYRRQDFPSAQTQFEILAQKNPNAPFSEKALFFAAESAMSSMGANSLDRAIVLFDQVVQAKGDLKWAARNEQAVIERKLGKPQDALLLYDEVQKGDARAAEKREATCGRGDIFFEMGGPENYLHAIEAYDRLISDKEAPIHWRNQALFKKGLCLEKQANRGEALETFYQVLESEARPDRRRELFWFYKAGFNAARLLEEDGKWESAAAVYQKLAAAGGGRSDEATGRLNRLRLEHFLWGD